MKKIFILATSVLFLCVSCNSSQKAESTVEVGHSSVNLLEGKWLVETEQRFFEKDNKRTETFELEQIPTDDAYVYSFQSDSLVSITNLKNEFAWDFKINKQDSVLSLININGDAEDDELVYKFENDKLILLRKMEDADPEDSTGSHHVGFLMTLKKIN